MNKWSMCLFERSMHCRLALRALSLPHTAPPQPPNILTTTAAMFH